MANFELQPLDGGDFRILIDLTAVGGATELEIDLSAHKLSKFRLYRVAVRLSGGSGATVDPELRRAAGASAGRDLIAKPADPTALTADVDSDEAGMRCYLPARKLWLFPGVDAGDDNVIEGEILIRAGWEG